MYAQSDGKSVNRRLPELDLARGPEVAILGADQLERDLWGRECAFLNSRLDRSSAGLSPLAIPKFIRELGRVS